jgi:regulatory protein
MEKTITNIETQKNNPNRLNVYLDDEFAFGVSRYVGAWLTTGKKISKEEIEQLVSHDAREKAFQKALHFISYHPRSEFEVLEKLTDLGFSEAMIDDVIVELREKNYINDRQFAENWIATRSQSKPRSRKMFSYELRKKHISDAVIDQALADAPTDKEMAYRLSEKYVRRYAHLDTESIKNKMKGVLARKAFPFDVIEEVIITILETKNKLKKE